MPERLTSWISENYPWIAALIGIASVGVRNELQTNRLSKSVFDSAGDTRFMKLIDCNQCRAVCQDSLRRELTDFKKQHNLDMIDLKKDLRTLISIHIKEP